ncbi:MAG: potassium-transporting ATPase subunit F [Planctomycetota bacterium]
MSIFHIVALVVVALLLVYLAVAMLSPEVFE